MNDKKYTCSHFNIENKKEITDFIFNVKPLHETEKNCIESIFKKIKQKKLESKSQFIGQILHKAICGMECSKSGIYCLTVNINPDILKKFNKSYYQTNPVLEFVLLKDEPSVIFIAKNKEILPGNPEIKNDLSKINISDLTTSTDSGDNLLLSDKNTKYILEYFNINYSEILNFPYNNCIIEKIFKDFALISEIAPEVGLSSKTSAKLITPLGHIDGLVSGSTFEFKNANLVTVLEHFGVKIKDRSNLSEDILFNCVAESIFNNLEM